MPTAQCRRCNNCRYQYLFDKFRDGDLLSIDSINHADALIRHSSQSAATMCGILWRPRLVPRGTRAIHTLFYTNELLVLYSGIFTEEFIGASFSIQYNCRFLTPCDIRLNSTIHSLRSAAEYLVPSANARTDFVVLRLCVTGRIELGQ